MCQSGDGRQGGEGGCALAVCLLGGRTLFWRLRAALPSLERPLCMANRDLVVGLRLRWWPSRTGTWFAGGRGGRCRDDEGVHTWSWSASAAAAAAETTETTAAIVGGLRATGYGLWAAGCGLRFLLVRWLTGWWMRGGCRLTSLASRPDVPRRRPDRSQHHDSTAQRTATPALLHAVNVART